MRWGSSAGGACGDDYFETSKATDNEIRNCQNCGGTKNSHVFISDKVLF